MNEGDNKSSTPDAPPAATAADDHLPTTRLPPVSAPPVHSRSGRPGSLPPAAHPPMPSSDADPARPQSLPYRRPSRIVPLAKSLLASLFWRQTERQPTARPPPPLEARIVRQRAGFASIAIGFVFAIFGVALGLRTAPGAPLAPVVTASLVLAHALAGLGMVALGLTLIRLGQRLLGLDKE
jgi:hypothetical protein